MALRISYLKGYYQLKRKVDLMSERDRILLFSSILILILFLWFFFILGWQMDAIRLANTNAMEQKVKANELQQKVRIINSLIQSKEANNLIQHYNKISTQLENANMEVESYHHGYISSKDLAKLLHDMLKQPLGVTLVDFSTIVLPPNPTTPPPGNQQSPQASGENTPAQSKVDLEPIRYRLILKGTYFAIMDYLRRVEDLKRNLYWDKFDYKVLTYPQGLATIEFYTLKPPTKTDLLLGDKHNEK